MRSAVEMNITVKRDLNMCKHGAREHRLWTVVLPVFLLLIFTAGCNRDPNVRKQKYLDSGKRYEKEGKFREAAIQVSNALKVDRNFSDAHYEMAKIYIKMGSIKEGYSELLRTIDLSPSNLPARIDLGSIYLMANKPDLTDEQAKAVLALDANNADAYALLSAIAARKGDRAGALANIQHALALNPNQASFHTTLALLESTDPARGAVAEQELQKAISLDQKDSHAHMVLAALLERKGDRTGAEQQYQAAITQTPTLLQARAALAGLYFRGGDKAKGEQTLHKAAEDLNDNIDASEVLKEYYFREKQPEMAESIFADLTSKYPKSFAIKMTYATILAARGEFAKVTPLSEQLAKSNPNAPQVQLLKAAILLNAGKVNDSFNVLQAATKSSPGDLQLQIALGKVAEKKGDYSVAESSFRTAEKLSPQNIEIQASLAALASRRGDATLLAQIANNTITQNPDFAPAYLWRGMAESNLKQYEKAEADMQTALAKNPDNAAAYTEFGQLRLRQQRLPDAVAMFEKALDKDPNQSVAMSQIVAVNLALKHPEQAMVRLKQQIQRAPNSGLYYSLLAALQLQAKDNNGARDSAKKAMELDPTDERAVQAYAQAVATLGDKDEAIRTWDKWATAHPKDGAAVSMLGVLEEAKGDQVKAIEYYKKALEIDGTQAIAANNLAYLMVTNGQNYDVALTYAQTARRILPESSSTADTLGWVYFYKGTYLSARDLLEGAVKQDPENAAINYHLGMTYSKLGKKPEAILHLKKALALEPNTAVGKDATAELAKMG